jgi:predicted PurR-regulated permease PerM
LHRRLSGCRIRESWAVSTRTENAFFMGLLILVTVAFVALLAGFFQPIFWAATIGILFLPVQHALERRLGGRASLAGLLTVILIFFTVLVPALLVASAVAREAADLYTRIQAGEWDPGAVIDWLRGWVPQGISLAERVGINVDELPERVSAVAVKGSQFIASLALTAGQNLAGFAVMFVLMLYLLFFVLRDGNQILDHIVNAFPLPEHKERELFAKFAEVSRATIKGTLVVGLVQGTLGGIIFSVLGLQGAVFWGVVMVILSALPAVGAGLVWVPAAIYLAVTGAWVKAAVLTAFGALVIGLVDNLLRPRLVGRDTKMPDYLILLSTLGGISMFGISGFVIGPIIASLFLAVWQMFETDMLASFAAGARKDGERAAAAEESPSRDAGTAKHPD